MSNVESHSTALSDIPVRMLNRTRQRFPLFQFECGIIHYSAFCGSKSNVESHSTSLSAVPGRMSSHTRQRFQFKGECRITLDRTFRPSRYYVAAHSTALSDLPGRVSGRNRQRFPLFKVECRVTRRRFLLFHTRRRFLIQGECPVTLDSFPPFQVKCRVAFDSAFCFSRSNVESHSKALSALPGRKSSHTRQVFPLFQIE